MVLVCRYRVDLRVQWGWGREARFAGNERADDPRPGRTLCKKVLYLRLSPLLRAPAAVGGEHLLNTLVPSLGGEDGKTTVRGVGGGAIAARSSARKFFCCHLRGILATLLRRVAVVVVLRRGAHYKNRLEVRWNFTSSISIGLFWGCDQLGIELSLKIQKPNA